MHETFSLSRKFVARIFQDVMHILHRPDTTISNENEWKLSALLKVLYVKTFQKLICYDLGENSEFSKECWFELNFTGSKRQINVEISSNFLCTSL